jgi:hypothetical protein
MVCGKNGLAKVGIDLISSSELRAIAQAYPSTTEKWMREGAENFNRGVMEDGLPAACKFADEMRIRALRSR